jgi:acetyl-CoA C-acetyltransferase
VTTIDPRTPVLVGVGAVTQREEDPDRSLEPLALMARALERAGEDAGTPALLAQADSVGVSRGFWDYPDPGRWLAQRFGAARATTVMAEIGVLQTTLVGRAAREIAEGRSRVALIAGGEARQRAQKALRAGAEAWVTRLPDREADVVLRPAADIISQLEIARGLAMPVGQYAMIENALRFAEGQSVAAHRQAVAELWSRMSEVAAGNPDAWRRERVAADAIRDEGPRNRMLAFPYTKLHNSQWNVDQAAGLILCSAAAAEAAGVPRERWVFPLALAESNHMLPLTERRALHRSPGFRAAAATALRRAGRTVEDLRHRELYSCFPAAVRVQAREMGMDERDEMTVTGGMAFGGGPLNNFVLQGIARMTQVLRQDGVGSGVVTAISGILTKQGVSLWSGEPADGGFHYDDVSAEAEAAVERVEVVAEAAGAATVASYTVLHSGTAPEAVVLCDLPDGRRTIAQSRDAGLIAVAEREELCGRAVTLADGSVRLAKGSQGPGPGRALQRGWSASPRRS